LITIDQLLDIVSRGEQVVSLANSKGGVLLIGVEDDGAITGAHPRYGDVTDLPKLQSACVSPPLGGNGKNEGNSDRGDHKDAPLQTPPTDIPALEAEIDRLVYALNCLPEEEAIVVGRES
jgi:hypothetical protein